MSVHAVISSAKNPKVAEAAGLLARRKEREATGLFAVEGAREAARAMDGGYELARIFVCEASLSAEGRAVVARAKRVETLAVTPGVFAKLVVREGSDGVLAVFRQRHVGLEHLSLAPAPLLLAVHGVEKPGNLGALLRTADGVGVDAVILLDGTVDLYNPHVVRGSVGALFGLKVAAASSAAFRAFCAARQVRVVAAALAEGAKPHFDERYTGATAILLGSEADGLPADWIAGADARVAIPMRGIADSLNVSVAGAVLLYEALRQRRGGGNSPE